jgi:hypothetical protein
VQGRSRLGLLVLAAALVAALAVVWWLVHSLDARVARALETVGSELLGTRVSVGAVDVDLRAGRATVRGVEVENPRGEKLAFSKEPAIRCEEIEVTIEPASLAGGGPIVLSEVRVRAPRLSAEVTPGGVNLLELERRVSRASPAEWTRRAGPRAAALPGAPPRLRGARCAPTRAPSAASCGDRARRPRPPERRRPRARHRRSSASAFCRGSDAARSARRSASAPSSKGSSRS